MTVMQGKVNASGSSHLMSRSTREQTAARREEGVTAGRGTTVTDIAAGTVTGRKVGHLRAAAGTDGKILGRQNGGEPQIGNIVIQAPSGTRIAKIAGAVDAAGVEDAAVTVIVGTRTGGSVRDVTQNTIRAGEVGGNGTGRETESRKVTTAAAEVHMTHTMEGTTAVSVASQAVTGLTAAGVAQQARQATATSSTSRFQGTSI